MTGLLWSCGGNRIGYLLDTKGKLDQTAIISAGLHLNRDDDTKIDPKSELFLYIPSCLEKTTDRKEKVVDKVNKKGEVIKFHYKYYEIVTKCPGFKRKPVAIDIGLKKAYKPYMADLLATVHAIPAPWVRPEKVQKFADFQKLITKSNERAKSEDILFIYDDIMPNYKNLNPESYEAFLKANPKTAFFEIGYFVKGIMDIKKSESQQKSYRKIIKTSTYTFAGTATFYIRARAKMGINGKVNWFERNLLFLTENYLANDSAVLSNILIDRKKHYLQPGVKRLNASSAILPPDASVSDSNQLSDMQTATCDISFDNQQITMTAPQKTDCLKKIETSIQNTKQGLVTKLRAAIYLLFSK